MLKIIKISLIICKASTSASNTVPTACLPACLLACLLATPSCNSSLAQRRWRMMFPGAVFVFIRSCILFRELLPDTEHRLLSHLLLAPQTLLLCQSASHPPFWTGNEFLINWVLRTFFLVNFADQIHSASERVEWSGVELDTESGQGRPFYTVNLDGVLLLNVSLKKLENKQRRESDFGC